MGVDAFSPIETGKVRNLEREIGLALLKERIDGALLVDLLNERIIPISEDLTGKLKAWIDFKDLSYEACSKRLILKALEAGEGKFIAEKVKLANVLGKLKTLPYYTVDFKLIEEGKDPSYKRLSFWLYKQDESFMVVSCEDVTSEKKGDVDPLTGLLDSSGFHEHVSVWIKDHPGKKYRIQRYNIDHFRDINGIYGHEAGDRLLKDFGAYMKKYDTPDSFSAHLNADHFIRFCSGDDPMSPEEYARLVPKAFVNYHLSVPITIHLGVYDLCEEDSDSFVMAYKALLALQTIKGDHIHSIAYYKKGMMKEEVEEQELLGEADLALKEGQFEPWYQPQVDYSTGKLVSAEVLTRWRHPKKGLLPPGRFLPVFERTGKIRDLDQAITQKACENARAWEKKYPSSSASFSINLSRNYILDPSLPTYLKEVVSSSELPPSDIHFEITESAYVKDASSIENVVKQMHAYGLVVEMDDFGSAYSSLNSLKDISVDVVKLDLKFLAGSDNKKRGEIILASVISMVKRLGMEVIAEGVETKEQADMLYGYGCEIMQGYYFSKPVPKEEYEKMLSGEITFPKASL